MVFDSKTVFKKFCWILNGICFHFNYGSKSFNFMYFPILLSWNHFISWGLIFAQWKQDTTFSWLYLMA